MTNTMEKFSQIKDVPEEVVPAPKTADLFAQGLRAMGVRQAFGVSGGAQALIWAGLSKALDVVHFRHECGAAFAAAEASLASGRPVAAFVTTGPGISNALTGMIAARTEGAKVVLISAYTSAAHRGRGGIQETSSYTMPSGGVFEAGAWFDDAVLMETPEQLPQILRRLSVGFQRPDGFAAHVSIPNAIQGATFDGYVPELADPAGSLPRAGRATVERCVDKLNEGPFAIWAGFGSRHAAAELRAFAEKTGAPVLCSPRAKGVFPESHPLFAGVTGMGGHGPSVTEFIGDFAPRHTLVLGTRLGEPTSFWNPRLVPEGGFVHVDLDPTAFGAAYPFAPTLAVQADIAEFLTELAEAWPDGMAAEAPEFPRPHPDQPDADGTGLVRPEALMGAVQRRIVDGSDAIVLAESGNAFTWATHYLRFDQANRYRVSTNLGSMGHAATGVVGAALGSDRRAVAILGDGAMLMMNEISTAVKHSVPAIWIVLNDGRYNMCHQGMEALGMSGVADATFPQVDFAMLARSMGAEGTSITREGDLADALDQAMTATGPFVIDVHIDADRRAPTFGRNEGLKAATASRKSKGASFPLSGVS